MTRRSCVLLATALVVAASATAGTAPAARTYPDAVGDVREGAGPDIVSVTVSHTSRSVTLVLRFAQAPPLRVSQREGWIDMLLVGFDVPPLGSRPIPDGAWRGADFAAGTHGPATTGLLVRLSRAPRGEPQQVARVAIVARRSTLELAIPRRALGDPAWFAFQVAAAREAEKGSGGGVDLAPARGTFRYTLSR
jgi:hypothetical protein